MPVPTIARISAYSAAEAPLVSVSKFLIIVISKAPSLPDPHPAGSTERSPPEAPRLTSAVRQQAVELGVRLMQLDALFMALLIDPPSV